MEFLKRKERKKMKIRKKLGMSLVGALTVLIGALLSAIKLNVSDEIKTAIVVVGLYVIGQIFKSFNIGQGLADQGKEVIKKMILIFLISFGLIWMPIYSYAQNVTCEDNLKACEELFEECTGCECPEVKAVECDDGVWKLLIKDRKLQVGLVTSFLLLLGGVGTLFLNPAGI